MPKLRVGKHAGSTYEEAATEDLNYCAWVLRAGRLIKPLSAFGKFLEKNYGGLLEVGRYKGHWFKKVLEEDADYCSWAATLEDPSPSLALFCGWCRERLGVEPMEQLEPPPSKKPRKEEECPSLDCKICFSGPVGAVLLPCGHMTCRRCSANFERKKCPFCREMVYQAAHAFL